MAGIGCRNDFSDMFRMGGGKKPGRKAVTLPTRLYQLYTELLGANIFRIAKSENQDKDGV